MKQVSPSVYLLAHTTVVNNGNPEKIVAAAGKLCYSSSAIKTVLDNLDEEKTKKFVDMLSSYGHQSPLEHISFTFGVEGISRACSHQLVRHRIASYSQQSQRYVDLNESFAYVLPSSLENNDQAREIFENQLISDIEAYKSVYDSLYNLYSEGVTDPKQLAKLKKKALEDARAVLPNACETKIILTMNARTLLNFFEERMCLRAQEEIREVANMMLDLCLDVAPNVFKYAGPSCAFGPCKEGNMTCGNKQKPREKQLVKEYL